MAALRWLVSVVSDGRSKTKAGPGKVTGLFFLVAGAGYVTNLMALNGYESGNCNNSEPIAQTVSELIGFERLLSPKAVVQIANNSRIRAAAFGQERTFAAQRDYVDEAGIWL